MKSTIFTIVMTLSSISCLTAQVLAPRCGGEGDSPCQFFSAELWANDSGTCDRGLKNTADNVEFLLLGKSGTCVNDNRRTVVRDTSWAGWALRQQRNGIQGNLPINAVYTMGTHNSFSNYNDGDRSALNMNQLYSITDQLQLGVRSIRIDPVFYFGQLRTCHSSPFDAIKATNADVCMALAGLGTVGLSDFFAPLIVGLNLAPPPVPEVLDTLLTAAAILGASNPINNRLFAYTVKEVAAWLDSNPSEVILLEMYEADSTQHGAVNQVFHTYLAGKVFTPADYANAGKNWPSISQLQKAHKQIIIFNDGGATPDGSQTDDWAFNRSYKAGGLNLANCTTNDTPISNFKNDNHNMWVQGGEGRTGADFAQKKAFTGTMEEADVTASVHCGTSVDMLDFWLGLDHAFQGFARTGAPDKRREAAIWSYEPNDFGKGGPAAISSTGRWSSVPPATMQPYVCAKEPHGTARNMYVPRSNWAIVGRGDFFGAGYNIDNNGNFIKQSDVCSKALGADYVFAAPETLIENNIVEQLLTSRSVNSAWLKYTAAKIPAAGFAGSGEVYMSRGGAAPDLDIKIAGFSDVSFKLALRVNERNILDTAALPSELTTHFTSLADGEVSISLAFNATALQALPSGGYSASIELLTQTDGQTGTISVGTLPITLHIMEPTTTDLTKSTNSACPAGLTCLAATVRPLCTFAQNKDSGGNIAITGGVTFTDTVIDDTGTPVVTTLGTIPINNHADQPSDNDNGVMIAMSGSGCVDNVVCASVNLPPGSHALAAQYRRDATYNSSASAALNIDTTVSTAPSAGPPVLDLGVMPAGGPAPKGKWTLPAKPGATFRITNSRPFTVSPSTGSLETGATVTVTVDPTFAVGDYFVTLTADAVTPTLVQKNAYRIVPKISIRSALSAATQSLRFSYVAQIKPVPPPAQQILMSSNTPLPVRVQTTTENGSDWLKAVANGDSSNPVSVSVNGYGLAAGTYRGTVILSSSGAGNPPVQVPVELDVTYSGVPALVNSNPPGMPIMVNGIRYITPAAFMGAILSFPYVTAPSGYLSLGPGRRAIFTGWTGGALQSQHTVIAFWGQTVTANFQVQYELTTNVFPACSGTITPSGGWYNQGHFHFMTATPVDQFQVQPGQELQVAIFTSPKTVTAHFICPAGQQCNHAGGPFTRATVNPAPNGTGWNNSFPQVTLTAGKPGLTVKSIQYSLSGAQEKAATTVAGSTVTIPITAEGITAVTYFATDERDNREPPITVNVKFDHTPPVVTPTFTPPLNSFGWANKNVAVQFSCSDSASGVAGSPVVVQATTEGISTVSGGCSDNAGNAAQGTAKVGIEKTNPTITASVIPAVISPPDGPARNVDVVGSLKAPISGADASSLAVIATDSTGAVTKGTACSMTSAGDFRCTLTLKTSPPGAISILVKASSKAANTAAATTTVTVNK